MALARVIRRIELLLTEMGDTVLGGVFMVNRGQQHKEMQCNLSF